MNKDFRNELDTELKSHVARLSERKREKEESRACQDELHAAFKKKCRTIVLPTFKEFSKYMKSLGWDSKIYVQEDQMIPTDNGWIKHAEQTTVVMMLFCQGEWSLDKKHGAPYIALVCDYRMDRIFLKASTVPTQKSDYSSWLRQIQLTELTRREMRENLAEFFSQLLRAREDLSNSFLA